MSGGLQWARAGGVMDISVSVTLQGSGDWAVSALFSGDSAPQQIGSSQSVTVVNGPIVASQSSMACPASVPGAATVECTVSARDQYGNPSSSGAAFTLAVSPLGASAASASTQYGTVQAVRNAMANGNGNGNGNRNGNSNLEDSVSLGVYTAQFKAPATDNAAIQLTFRLSQSSVLVGAAQDVTVLPIPVVPAQSEVSCPAAATVGVSVSCVVTIRQSDGALVGDENLVSAISVTAENKDVTPEVTIVHVSTGTFSASFTPTRTSNGGGTKVKAFYATSGGLVALGGTVPSVTVQGAGVSASKSSFRCASQGTAGVAVE